MFKFVELTLLAALAVLLAIVVEALALHPFLLVALGVFAVTLLCRAVVRSKEIGMEPRNVAFLYDFFAYDEGKELRGFRIYCVAGVRGRGEIDPEELARRLVCYQRLLTDLDVAVISYRRQAEVEVYREKLRKARDSRELMYSIWEEHKHLDVATEKDRLIHRIDVGEVPLLTRTFFVVYAGGKDLDEVRRKLDSAGKVVELRAIELGLKVKRLKGHELLKSSSLLPPLPSPKLAKGEVVDALSLDLSYMNPLVGRRLPPLGDLMKGTYIGRTLDGLPFCLNFAIPPNANVIVIGPMGTGKSCFAKSFVYRSYLVEQKPFWVFDVAPKGEYLPLVEKLGGIVIDFKEAKVNPFVLYGRDPLSVAEEVSKLATYIAALDAKERFVFRRCVVELYKRHGVLEDDRTTWSDEASNEVNFVSLYRYIMESIGEDRPDRELLLSIAEKIEPLARGAYALGRATVDLDELYRSGKPVAFVLTGLNSVLQKAIVWTVLEQINALFYNRYGVREEVRLLIVVEEAHLFMKRIKADVPGGVLEPPFGRFLRLMRKSGISLFAITHTPQDLGEDAPIFLEGVGILAMFPSSDAVYLEFCEKNLHLMDYELEALKMMRRGECFVKYHGEPRPIYVRVAKAPYE